MHMRDKRQETALGLTDGDKRGETRDRKWDRDTGEGRHGTGSEV